MSGKGGNGRIDFGSLESGMELAHEIPRMLITEVVGIRAFMGGGESGFFPWRGPWRGWPRFVTVKISISVNLRWNGRNSMCISFLLIRLFRSKSSSFGSEMKNCFFRWRGIGHRWEQKGSRKLAGLANICRPGELPLRYESLKDWPSVMPTALEYSFLFMYMCISSPVGSFQWYYSTTKT